MSTVFFCNECGYESSKWMGQCPSCKAWNTFTEELVAKNSKKKDVRATHLSDMQPTAITEVSVSDTTRYTTHLEELDRVLGGGIVPGSLVLVGGDPGIGKSTLLLQVCKYISDDNNKVLYVSGEESLHQIKMRATRIGDFTDNLLLYCQTNLTDVENVIRKSAPKAVIIDSIQTMYCEDVSSAPGSVSQVREATNVLLQLAKGLNITIFIVGHVTKEGTVAGPRVLEHMVDTVLYFEGDRYASYRILRAVKNRFGSTNEIGVFEMRNDGLSQVKNPSEFMLEGRPADASGSVVVCCLEGTRPMLMEIQSLVCRTSFPVPRRQATGCDFNRVNLLMAVLEKRCGLKLGECDAYVNVAGGLKLNEPAIDLGIVMAIVSGFENMILPEGLVVFGEVGLSGEVRAVSSPEVRVMEALKLGFEKVMLPKSAIKSLRGVDESMLIGVENVADVISYMKGANRG